ncbi:MAG: NUDIX hydrolase, partial [Bryobacteraceae bacterium]|nr:NUDIX hydrolase [Bryobacteraceae bacterium]
TVTAGNASGVVVMPVLAGDDVRPAEAGNVVLVRHFRHATRSWHLEFPRGFGTPGSHPDDDARTELREEIGAVSARLVDLGLVYADSGLSGTPVKLYFAEITTFAGPEAAEGITAVELVSPDRLAALIRDGEITDGFTINAYTRALLRGLVPAPTIGS